METKLNIAEILKNKPQGTKLYSPLFGNVYLLCVEICVENCIIKVKHHGRNENIATFFRNGKYFSYPESEPLLFPSKEMRDWSKFAWKKGDILVSKGRRTLHVIFEGFNDDTYTTFKGKHFICDYSNKENCNDEEYYNDYHKEVEERTIEFEKDNVNNIQTYINIIEKRLGGKLNRETLEIEKQLEFKDGDILFSYSTTSVFIFSRLDKRRGFDYYVALDCHGLAVSTGNVWCYPGAKVRYATEEEKQQLFDALAKEGKAWNAEKKHIIDLKPKVDELKPFDKVLVRDDKEDQWSANIFSYQVRGMFHCLGEGYWKYCIPYEGNEHLLGTTKNVEN